MLRSLILAAAFLSSAGAAIWPEQLGRYQRKSIQGSEIRGDLRGEWDEYGEEALEQADYGSFKALAFRFKDTTGAYAASLEPAGRVTSRIGNYLVSCSGECPKDFLKLAEAGLPKISHSPIPTLAEYLPQQGRVRGSERYIVGPLRLGVNAPEIAESAVAFQFGTEGAMARYRTPKGVETLAIFSYPTPQIARQQAPAFEGLPGAAAKRTGSLVAVVVPSEKGASPDPGAAQKLLVQVTYQGSVSWDETPPLTLKPQSAAQMILAILALAGVVLGFCLLSGLAFGAFRVVARRFGYLDAEGRLITLGLGGK